MGDAYAPIPVLLTGNICKSRSTKSGVLVEITTRYNGTGDERYNTLVDPSTVRERDNNRPYVVCSDDKIQLDAAVKNAAMLREQKGMKRQSRRRLLTKVLKRAGLTC